MRANSGKMSIKTLVSGAILTALVIILQFMGAFVRFGPFSISLVLIPIVIGAAICGIGISTWLGFVFGLVVLLSGDAAAFMVVNVAGTVITVLLKGIFCGLAAGMAYMAGLKLFKNQLAAVLLAAVACPVANTGIFLLGCLLFFMETVSEWAAASGLGGQVGSYMILGLVGANFLFELAFNLVLSPIVVRIVRARKKI